MDHALSAWSQFILQLLLDLSSIVDFLKPLCLNFFGKNLAGKNNLFNFLHYL